MQVLDGEPGPAAERLRHEYREALGVARAGEDPRTSSDNALRQRVLPASRHALDTLRSAGTIGDEAYRAVEQELDWLELSSRPAQSA
ncbi:MAG: hypothetical protein EOP65_08075 [Sphingomonas sp.]|nr:MAG: hypothetical protein EOP65_08075 [Sphingomonas sp.]